MENKQEEQISWRETWEIHRRCFLLCRKARPQYFPIRGTKRILDALSPFVTLFLSARFLNELTGERNPEILTKWVMLILVVTGALGMLRALFKRWDELEKEFFYSWKNWIYGKKMLDMDFAKADDTANSDLLIQIIQTESFSGRGLINFQEILLKCLEDFFRVLGGLTLSVSLFFLPVAAQSQGNALLKASLWLATLGILVVLIVNPILISKSLDAWNGAQAAGRKGNRLSKFYGYDLYLGEKRSLDMRIYRQDLFGRKMQETFDTEGWGLHSVFAKLAHGIVGGMSCLIRVFFEMMMGFVYLFVCLKAWYGAFGVGSVTQYVGALHSLTEGVSDLLTNLTDARGNAIFLKKVLEYLDIPNEMYQGCLTVEKRNDREYEVEFRDVSFRYPNSNEYALRHVNMKFKVGERLAVVGQNGSGKTTFIKLLCRLYDPTEGQILLNGIDIKKYDYQEYMSVFSIVFQDFQLLHAPIGENIAAGIEVDREKALDCIEKAGLGDWYRNTEGGLDAILYQKSNSEEGIQVSGGEEQKLAIARSLYRDAPFIVLDEPTAALDPIAEYEIYTRFNDIISDRTAIYISHRLSSCRFCDEIAVFHEGQVIEKGTHEALLAGNGKYAELWNAQAQYYVEGETNLQSVRFKV